MARKECVIDGLSYAPYEVIENSRHSYRSLRRAYSRKLIGHPYASYRQSREGLLKNLEVSVESVAGDRPQAQAVWRSGPWYDIYVGEEKVNERPLKKKDAIEYASNYGK